jgi:ribonuclease HI
MMAARRCGMPDNAIRVHANTLERMKYKVQTAYGTSDSHCEGAPGEPLFGTGQGSGASPAVWLTLVVVLMNTLDRITRERIRFRSPDATDHRNRLIDAFVDDTSLAITDTIDPMTPTEMSRRMEKIAQKWERLLFYSGGALNLKKCSWSMLQWEWKNGRPNLYKRHDNDANITLVTKSTGTNTRSMIQYNPPTKSTRILGVYLNPLGDFTDQIEILKKKSDQMSNRIKYSRISSDNVHTFLHTMYAPSMLYPLPAMAVDEENLASVQTSMITTVLQKMGASKTTPTAIRHGPLEMGGLNIIDLRTELGICNLKFLRNAIYTGSEAGKLLIMSLKYSQLEAGVPFALLEKPHINISYVTPTWATSVRQFLYQHNITVNISESLRIRYSNTFDRCIMDSAAIHRYHPGQQRDINLVRLYIQAITLSDLSTSDGTAIRECFLLGCRRDKQTIRKHWPRQSTPTNSQRRLWRNYITSTFISHGTKWRTPLGPSASQHRPRHSGSPRLVPPSTQKPGHECESLREYITRLPKWHTRLLSNWKQIATDLQIWRSFRSRQRITIASDGGLKSWMGTHGWKIVSRSGSTLFSGSGPVDGPYDISHSTRSELGGLTAPLLLVTSLAKFWGLQHKCRYKWLTDSKAAISKVTLITNPTTSSPRRYPDDVDYITAIRELHKSLGGRSLRPTWIKGHQDDDTAYDKLSMDARLNVDVDGLASEHFWSGQGTRPTSKIMHLHEHQVTIAINGVIYPTRIDEQIRYHINGSYLKDFLQQKHGWSEKLWGNIDIMAFGRHFKTLSGPKRVQHMKFVHDLQPLGVNSKFSATF